MDTHQCLALFENRSRRRAADAAGYQAQLELLVAPCCDRARTVVDQCQKVTDILREAFV